MQNTTQTVIWLEYPFEDKGLEIRITFDVQLAELNGRLIVETVRPTVRFAGTYGDDFALNMLEFGQDTPINVTLETGDTLTGELRWTDELATVQPQQVRGQLSYYNVYRNKTWHYEGFMVEFGIHQPTPQPTPTPIPGPDPGPSPAPPPAPNDVASAVTVARPTLSEEELFPFLYLQPWPSVSNQERAAEFMEMPADLSTSNAFVKDLLAAKQTTSTTDANTDGRAQSAGDDNAQDNNTANADAAAAMQAAAVTLIDDTIAKPNSPTYPDGFFDSVASLPPPLNRFPLFLRSLKAIGSPDFQELTLCVDLELGGWDAIATDISTPSYKEAVEKVWASTFALIIRLGYRHDLLSDLIRCLVVDHLLTAALPFAPVGTQESDGNAEDTAQAAQTADLFETADVTDGKIDNKVDRNSDDENSDDENSDGGKEAATADDGSEQEIARLQPSAETIWSWSEATLVLPATIFPLPPAKAAPSARSGIDNNTHASAPPEQWVRPYAFGAARAVHYQPTGYRLGEIQRIENVMRGESRENTRRDLRRNYSAEAEAETHTDIADRVDDDTSSDFVNQVRKTLAEHVSTTAMNDYQTAYGMPTNSDMTVTGGWTVTEDPAGGNSEDVAKFARDVVRKTVRRISSSVQKRRAAGEMEEMETRQVSRFDNVGGTTDISGVYRWVNQIYHLTSRQLGDRLVLEMSLTNPAENLIKEIERFWRLDLTPPDPPSVTSYSEISSDPTDAAYYLKLLSAYGLHDCPPPPPASLSAAEGFSSGAPVGGLRITLPKGYSPKSAQAQITTTDTTTAEGATVSVGATPLTAGANGAFTGDLPTDEAPPQSEDGVRSLWAAVSVPAPTSSADEGDTSQSPPPPAAGATWFTANVSITCIRDEEILDHWKFSVFQRLQESYAAKMKAYRAQLESQRDEVLAQNPRFLDEVINTQVTKGALGYLYDEWSVKTATASDGAPDGSPSQRDLGEPRVMRFLRMLISWSDISAQFFVGDQTNAGGMPSESGALMEAFNPGRRFRTFLRAAHMRLLVPVQQEKARAALLLLNAGMLWVDDPEFAPCLESDIDIIARMKRATTDARFADEIQHHSESWTIETPTTMTMLSHDDDFARTCA